MGLWNHIKILRWIKRGKRCITIYPIVKLAIRPVRSASSTSMCLVITQI